MARDEIARRMADYWLECNGLSGRPTRFLSDYDPAACDAFRALDPSSEDEVVSQALRLANFVTQIGEAHVCFS